jgi:lipid-A-disaccharide synthase
VLALLPGSRGGEVSMLAPLFLETAAMLVSRYPGLKLVIPAANAARLEQLRELVAASGLSDVSLLDGRSREVMLAADAVLMASGTATLEALLLKRPMVVAYRMAPLSWALVRRLAKTPFASLPNILAGERLVPEFIQEDATAENLAGALGDLLAGQSADQVQRFTEIHQSLRLGFAERSADALLALAQDHRHA